MALIKCPDCGNEISSNAVSCPHCGKIFSDIDVPIEYSTIYSEDNAKRVAAVIIGIILQICGIIVFCSFNSEYIDPTVKFGSDYNTYTYQVYTYIAIALRWGLSGILIGIGALLQFHKESTSYSTTRVSEYKNLKRKDH